MRFGLWHELISLALFIIRIIVFSTMIYDRKDRTFVFPCVNPFFFIFLAEQWTALDIATMRRRTSSATPEFRGDARFRVVCVPMLRYSKRAFLYLLSIEKRVNNISLEFDILKNITWYVILSVLISYICTIHLSL